MQTACRKNKKALALIVALPFACTPHSLTFVNDFSLLSSSSLRQSWKSYSFVLHSAQATPLGGAWRKVEGTLSAAESPIQLGWTL